MGGKKKLAYIEVHSWTLWNQQSILTMERLRKLAFQALALCQIELSLTEGYTMLSLQTVPVVWLHSMYGVG